VLAGGAGLLVGEDGGVGDGVGDGEGDGEGDAVGDEVGEDDGDEEGEAVGDDVAPSAQAAGAVNDSEVAASPAATSGTTRAVPRRFMLRLPG
jgi:hypothetical protein